MLDNSAPKRRSHRLKDLSVGTSLVISGLVLTAVWILALLGLVVLVAMRLMG